MPNHVDSILRVRGTEKDLKRFAKANRIASGDEQTELSFEKAVPIPKGADTSTTAWFYENWGTKWDAQETYCSGIYEDRGTDCLEYSFWTAWSPAEAWLEAVSKKYPSLTFALKYADEGGCFPDGILRAHNGKVETEEIIF